MNNSEEYNKALSKALALMTYSDRTSSELKAKLIRSGFSEEVSEEVVAFLIEDGLVNDRRYAEYYAVCYSEKRSLLRIRNELVGKGIDKDLVEEILEDYDDSVACKAALEKELRKRGLESLEDADYATKGKINAALYRKGFILSQFN